MGIHLDFANPSSLIRNCKFTSFVIDRISRNPADPHTAFVKRINGMLTINCRPAAGPICGLRTGLPCTAAHAAAIDAIDV